MNERRDIPGIKAGDVEAYVASTLHVPLLLRPWLGAAKLPPYLRDAYRFFEGEIMGAPVLWLFAQGEEITPKAVSKQVTAMEDFWPERIVLACHSLASYDRQRLIQRGINFLVPGTQMYLPDLGVDFRSRVRQVRRRSESTFRPSTQVLYLYLLTAKGDLNLTAAEIAPVLGYTKMTMTRAVAELLDARIIEVTRTGRENVFRLAGPREESWMAAQDRLVNPVVRRVKMPFGWDAEEPIAGLTALSEYSMLAEPTIPVRAVGPSYAATLGEPPIQGGWEEALMARDDNEVEIEVWSYDPRTLSGGQTVDPLSLYLSLRDDPDERVQQALEVMMRGLEW